MGSSPRPPRFGVGLIIETGRTPEPARFRNGIPDYKRWQKEADAVLWPANERLLSAPTGGGKSLVMKGLGIRDLIEGRVERVLVSVPQQIIGPSFAADAVRLPDGTVHNWTPGYFLLDSSANVGQELNKFFMRPVGGLPRLNSLRTAVCSHAALVAYMKDCTTDLSRVSLIIDEAHHSCIPGDETEANKLGGIVTRWLTQEHGPLTLGTATWFRSDRQPSIPDAFRDVFTRYTLSIVDYLDSLEYLREIEIRFLAGEPFECVRRCYREDADANTIIYQSPITKDRDKYDELHRLTEIVQAHSNGRTDIIDLVTDDPARGNQTEMDLGVADPARDLVKRRLLKGVAQGRWGLGPDDRRASIIALYMGHEGFDFPALQRSILIGPRYSMPAMQQRLGRLPRDFPGKERVQFNIVLPFAAEDIHDSALIQQYSKAMLTTLALGCLINPPKFENKAERDRFNELGANGGEGGLTRCLEVAGAAVPDCPIKDEEGLVLRALQREAPEYADPITARVIVRLANHIQTELIKQIPDLDIVKDAFGGIRTWKLVFGAASLRELNRIAGNAPVFDVLYATQLILKQPSPERAQYEEDIKWRRENRRTTLSLLSLL